VTKSTLNSTRAVARDTLIGAVVTGKLPECSLYFAGPGEKGELV